MYDIFQSISIFSHHPTILQRKNYGIFLTLNFCPSSLGEGKGGGWQLWKIYTPAECEKLIMIQYLLKFPSNVGHLRRRASPMTATGTVTAETATRGGVIARGPPSINLPRRAEDKLTYLHLAFHTFSGVEAELFT